MEDRQIIDLLWERSEQGINEIARKYGRYCHKIAFNILADREDSEECISDTYLKVWNTIPPNRPESLSAYIGRIVRNLSLNKWEQRGAQKRGGGQICAALDELSRCIPSNSGRSVEDVELAEIINSFLAQMEVEKRRIFIKRYWYMDSVKEISKELGFSESRVKMSLYRSRSQLRLWLEKEGVSI